MVANWSVGTIQREAGFADVRAVQLGWRVEGDAGHGANIIDAADAIAKELRDVPFQHFDLSQFGFLPWGCSK
jgi:hypothetical protein